MGIPKFFKWLTRRYPQILVDVKREEQVPPIDNLYLDLNGIVHNCIHGNDAKLHERVSQLDNFEEVWVNIMKAIDELVHTVKPRKVLFLAVDGVAPRAKMNQQRSRRFRSAKDSALLKEKLQQEGKQAPSLFDSNAISPGTKFMHELSKQLDFFVQFKQNTDPLYQKLEKVILSDASVPGEGEHKMMDYIRQARNHDSYDANTRHCFYGADADLIMLSLLTHEPNFIILREEHVVRKIKQGGVQRLDLKRTNNYQLIFISLLREYFLLEYRSLAQQMKMRFSLERIIDDFVFFCFFIGNDFLPSLTALDIGEGSLDAIIQLYKTLLPQMEDYITFEGKIYWDRAEPFIKMLGKHEYDAFRERVHKIGQMREERLISFDPEMSSAQSVVNRTQLVKQRIREKLNEKKRKKILGLSQRKKDKTTKKFLLLKKFEEDEIAGQTMSMKQREARDIMLIKYQKLRDRQREDERNMHSQEDPIAEEVKQVENLRELINGLKEEYFSDLNIDDVDDDFVSDISESEINLDNLEEGSANQDMEKKVEVTLNLQDKYEQENFQFMQQFIKVFHAEPDKAKEMYYSAKLKFDIREMEGRNQQKKMLMKYLEGLQWVLYYYYRGAQHWRWYYPYHYAPMISDLDENIVSNFLGGKHCIEEFEIDHNCAEVNEPYTPFQQLLSILPYKSLNQLMPSFYSQLVLSDELKSFFPDDFDIDLNGRTLTYEAACLIPFCDERLFIQQESKMLAAHTLSEDDKLRNTITFSYKQFTYDRTLKMNTVIRPLPLESSLPSFENLEYNYVRLEMIEDYEKVGKFAFKPELLKGVKQPCVDFPSFTYLGVQEVSFDEKVLHEVSFQRVLLKIPQAREDTATEYLEKRVTDFLKVPSKEVYVDFPYQYEAFPCFFQNKEFTFTVYGDDITNIYKTHKERQGMDEEKFQMMSKRVLYKLQDQGFLLDHDKTQAFVSYNKVTDVNFDSRTNQYYKVYSQDQDMLPLAMLTYRRDGYHFHNLAMRCGKNLLNSYKVNSEVVCLNSSLFGVMGTVQEVDHKNKIVKIAIDKRDQQSKIHDPFLGQKCLQKKLDVPLALQVAQRRYYTDHAIEQMLKIKSGVINRLTGSLLVTFNDRQKWDRVVIDLGLNLKNFAKKVHIPDFVRFVVEEDVADYQFDQDYTHNQHARGTRHLRKHWEYSEDCFEIIKEYKEKYPFVIDVIVRTMRSNKSMLTLKDIFGKAESTEISAQQKIKEIANWIEQLPISKLPYVEMGFDALNQDLIQVISDHSKLIKDTYRKIQLRCRDVEHFNPSYLFQEQFPFWSLPYNERSINDYRVGDRVMSVKSVMREYVPFGMRGTVVGKTNDKIIVMFDEQFLQGNNIYGHCQNYRGAFLDPNFLINLTKRFNSIMNSNQSVAESFQETPIEQGEPNPEAPTPQQDDEGQEQRVIGGVDDSTNQWQDVNQKPKIIRNQKPANQMISQKPSDFPRNQQQQHVRQQKYEKQVHQHQAQMRQQFEKRQAKLPPGQQTGFQPSHVPKTFLHYSEKQKSTPLEAVAQSQPFYKVKQRNPVNDSKTSEEVKINSDASSTQPSIVSMQAKQGEQEEIKIEQPQQVTYLQQDPAFADEAILSTSDQPPIEAFKPSSNQMRDYLYDDEDDYYGEQEELPDHRVEDELDLYPNEAYAILGNLQHNPDIQKLLSMMNPQAQQLNPLAQNFTPTFAQPSKAPQYTPQITGAQLPPLQFTLNLNFTPTSMMQAPVHSNLNLSASTFVPFTQAPQNQQQTSSQTEQDMKDQSQQ